MNSKSIFCILILGLVLRGNLLFSQEEPQKTIDSAMAISPAFMPVYYTFIEPHFYTSLHYRPIKDTSIVQIHQFDPLLKTENIYQTLGILGQAHQSINYSFSREQAFSLITPPYPLYYKRQKDMKLYEVKTSYTRLAYTYGFPKENSFEAVHAQSFRGVTAVVNLHGYSNAGYYYNQGVANFNIDALLHYEIPSGIYGFTFSYIFNRFKLQENGGISNYSIFYQNKATELTGYPVKSNYGQTHLKSHDMLFQQYVNIKDKKGRYYGTITHSFQFNHFKNNYFDTHLDSTYYQPEFLSLTDTIQDSLQSFNIINSLQWGNFSPMSKISDKNYFFRIAGGIMHEYTAAKIPYYIGNTFTLFARTHIRLFSIMNIYGQIAYSFSGYNNNDATVEAKVEWTISKKLNHHLGFEGAFYRFSPDYIYSKYTTNHNLWDTTWNKQNNLRLSAYWTIWGYKASFNYFLVNDLVMLNQESRPFCVETPINVFQFHLYAPIRIKGFGFDANMYLQYASKSYISVPLFAGKASTFYVFKLFKKKMQLQIGFDMMYTTSYMANGYDPILHQFYYQDQNTTGNYFYLDANITIQVQRIAFFFRAGHFLSGIISNNYFSTPFYPETARRFNLGITWRFYD